MSQRNHFSSNTLTFFLITQCIAITSEWKEWVITIFKKHNRYNLAFNLYRRVQCAGAMGLLIESEFKWK